MTLRQRIRFYQQLAVLTRAGVPLRSSLPRLESRLTGSRLKILTREIEAGRPIGDAFVAAGFSRFECNLVAAGERSARLETIYERLAEFWTRELHLYESITRSLLYPIVMLHLTLFVYGLVAFFTIGPKEGIGTLVVSFVLLYVVGFAVYFGIRMTWRSDGAQRFWLFLPLVGSTLATASAYRWITALRLEFTSGIPLPDAVADAWLASGTPDAARLAVEAETELRAGGELSGLVQRWHRLPRDWVDFIETGEISGALETAFTQLETEAARAWNLTQQRLVEWLPKIVSYALLIVAALLIGRLFYQVTIAPVEDIEKIINGS